MASDGSAPAVAVALAGGTGSRFGTGTPKQLVRIAGHSILHHSLRRLDESGQFDSLVVAANPDWSDEISQICSRAIFETPWSIVDGGDERNLSVYSAIKELTVPEAKVLVHDSVRPLVTEILIRRVVNALDESRAVLPIVPSVDPLVEVSEEGRVASFPSRQAYHRGQSPQGFWLSDLRSAMSAAAPEELGRFSTIYELMRFKLADYPIATVEGDLNNLKVTMPVDQMIAGQLLLGD